MTTSEKEIKDLLASDLNESEVVKKLTEKTTSYRVGDYVIGITGDNEDQKGKVEKIHGEELGAGMGDIRLENGTLLTNVELIHWDLF